MCFRRPGRFNCVSSLSGDTDLTHMCRQKQAAFSYQRLLFHFSLVAAVKRVKGPSVHRLGHSEKGIVSLLLGSSEGWTSRQAAGTSLIFQTLLSLHLSLEQITCDAGRVVKLCPGQRSIV